MLQFRSVISPLLVLLLAAATIVPPVSSSDRVSPAERTGDGPDVRDLAIRGRGRTSKGPAHKKILGKWCDDWGTRLWIKSRKIIMKSDPQYNIPANSFKLLNKLTKWGKVRGYLVAFNERNGGDDAYAGLYSKFDFLDAGDNRLKNKVKDLHYCQIGFDYDSSQAAVLDKSTRSDFQNLQSGCNGFPWSKLHRC